MKRGEIRRAIMVVTDNLTPFAKSCLGEIASKGYLIEVFQVSRHSASKSLPPSLRFLCAVFFLIFPYQILLKLVREEVRFAEPDFKPVLSEGQGLLKKVTESGVPALFHVAHMAF